MLVTPYLAECNHAGGGHVADVRGPYKTITAKHTGGIVAPSLIQYHTEQTENVRASGLGAPIPTVDASNRYGLTCANLVKYYSGVVGEKMEEPLPTVTAIDHNAVCAAHVVKFKGNEVGTRPTDALPTQTSAGVFALCDTLLCKAGPDDNLYRWPMIRDLLNRYCGYELADDDLLLLNIGGTLYFIADIGPADALPERALQCDGVPTRLHHRPRLYGQPVPEERTGRPLWQRRLPADGCGCCKGQLPRIRRQSGRHHHDNGRPAGHGGGVERSKDMDKKKLMELAERYQCKADTAFQNYQETGITRYDTARRNNEDMAEALRMAASAKEDHDRMIHLRGVLSQLAWRAAEANRASEEDRPRKMQAVLGELLSAARMQGLIRDEGGDFK